jgi:hypothetical protein
MAGDESALSDVYCRMGVARFIIISAKSDARTLSVSVRGAMSSRKREKETSDKTANHQFR